MTVLIICFHAIIYYRVYFTAENEKFTNFEHNYF
jgi:hypothetical protein